MPSPDFELLRNKLAISFGVTPDGGLSEGATEFGATSLAGAIVDAGSWPPPPQPFNFLDDAGFLEWVWGKVDALLRDPVRSVTLSNGAQAVQVLGAAVFVKGRSGQLHPFLWDDSGKLVCPGSRLVMVTEVPHGVVWLTRVVYLAMEIRMTAMGYPQSQHLDNRRDYALQMARLLMRRVRTHHDLRRVRAQIAQALGIDADVLRLCHRMHIHGPLASKACVWQYNLCVRHKAELLEVERVAPNAVGVYAALCEQSNFPLTGEPTQRLKHYLMSLGMSSRTWLLVVRDGNRLLPIVRQFYKGTPAGTVGDVMKVMNGLQVSRRLPNWVLQALFGEWGNAAARRTSYFKVMESSMPNLRHLVACVSKEFERPDALQEEQLAEVVHWVTEPTTGTLTRTQRQGGWRYLVLAARSFHRLQEEKEAADGLTWNVPFESLELPTMKLFAIGSALQLLEEGRRMRNCAGRWIERCAGGDELLVSVRASDGRRIATASYQWGKGLWQFSDAKGPMNRPLDAKTMKALKAAACLVPGSRAAVMGELSASLRLAPTPDKISDVAHSVSPELNNLKYQE